MDHSCLTCNINFLSRKEHDEHDASDWHRYNINNSLSECKSVSYKDYKNKGTVQEDAANEKGKVYCQPCNKTFLTVRSYVDHSKSKQHKLKIQLFDTASPDDAVNPNVSIPDDSSQLDPPSGTNTGNKAKSDLVKEQVQGNSNKKRDTISNGTKHYALFAPHVYGMGNNGGFKFIFHSVMDCIVEQKKYYGSRFKSFQLYEDALEFVNFGPAQMESQKEKMPWKEEKCFLRKPTRENYMQFYRVIERGNVKRFNEMVARNPIYLVNTIDTPAMISNEDDVNALHICCFHKQSEICAKMLEAVSSTDLYKLIYPDESEDCLKRRVNHLLDCYLNTPDGRPGHLTPLHRGLLEGAVGCVRVLMSYPNCSRNFVHQYESLTEFLNQCDLPSEAVRNEMKLLLGDHYYVPIFHDEDKLFTSIITEPMSSNFPLPQPDDQRVKVPAGYNGVPSYKLHGYAGPMSHEDAKNFSSEWRQSISSSPKTPSAKRMNNIDLNTIGRKLAIKMEVPFKEYWNFLGKFINITIDEGERELEVHLERMKSEAEIERRRRYESDLLDGDTKSNSVVARGRTLISARLDSMGSSRIRSLSACQKALSNLGVYTRSILVYILKCQRERPSRDLSLSLSESLRSIYTLMVGFERVIVANYHGRYPAEY